MIPYKHQTHHTQTNLRTKKAYEVNKMEEQITNWLEEEEKNLQEPKEFETLPSLVLEENKVVEFEVDFSNPFEQWQDTANGVIKKIIPVVHEGERKNFWLNVKNPTYREIIVAGKLGTTKFKVMRTGQKKDTKYNIIKE